MTWKLVIRPDAEAELTEAFDWYEQRVPGLGSQFLLAVDAMCRPFSMRNATRSVGRREGSRLRTPHAPHALFARRRIR